uniref:Uncharacterized protein n=1 Tax=Clandestinovirus TaxID=2831644 RepID=A0A8F8KQX2_9VIRU|nr:hypothetical protein KOM_12_260 [Clandestinovirus]
MNGLVPQELISLIYAKADILSMVSYQGTILEFISTLDRFGKADFLKEESVVSSIVYACQRRMWLNVQYRINIETVDVFISEQHIVFDLASRNILAFVWLGIPSHGTLVYGCGKSFRGTGQKHVDDFIDEIIQRSK